LKIKGEELIEKAFLITTNNTSLPLSIDNKNIFRFNRFNGVNKVLKETLNKRTIKNLYSFICNRTNKYLAVELFIPHFINLSSNHLALNIKKLLPRKKISISIYPDGIALLYNARINIYGSKNRTIISIFIRYIAGLLTGMYYRPFLGTLVDPFRIIDKIYTYHPSLTLKHSAGELIKIPAVIKQTNGNNIVIVGSDHNISEQSMVRFFNDIFSKHNLKDRNIYYKPHPAVSNDKFTNFINDNNFPIDIINDKKNMELLVEKFHCNTAISILSFSTVLINLKLIYGNSIHCAIFMYSEVEKKLPKYITNDFEKILRVLDIKKDVFDNAFAN